MNTFLYVIIFMIGCFFGSFFTLAVYRIPKKEDILIKHSYCPNCNHRLGFFDLFPVFSYIILGAKCRYCKQKIRPRYFILEILSGLTFVILAFVYEINVFELKSIINFGFIMLYIAILFIILGIDKENIKVEKSVIACGYGMEIVYIIYQYTLGVVNVYQYVMYFSFLIILLILSIITKKITLKDQYSIQNLYLSLYIMIFCGSKLYILTVILTLFIIIIYRIITNKGNTSLPIAFYMSVSNIIVIIMSNIIMNYMM